MRKILAALFAAAAVGSAAAVPVVASVSAAPAASLAMSYGTPSGPGMSYG